MTEPWSDCKEPMPKRHKFRLTCTPEPELEGLFLGILVMGAAEAIFAKRICYRSHLLNAWSGYDHCIKLMYATWINQTNEIRKGRPSYRMSIAPLPWDPGPDETIYAAILRGASSWRAVVLRSWPSRGADLPYLFVQSVDNFSGPSLRDFHDGTAGSLMPEATNSLNSPYHLAVSTSTNEAECHLNEKGSRVDLMFSTPRLESNEGDLTLARLSQPNYLEKQKQRYNSREKIEPKLNNGNYHGRDPIATCEMTSKSSSKFQKSSDYAKSKSST
ncbi:hypothetical protein PGT21_014552 [Puccinia graminis f. sp. tritici]|nr:hypothetical protein PGT21_014552 [Puccinia graminis f. sp. tritici]